MTDLDLQFVRIPASEFSLGSSRARDHQTHEDETPIQLLNVTDFMIMRFPVTNLQYARFMQAVSHRPPLFWKAGLLPQGKEDHPVVGVSYYDAIAFCAWAADQTGLPIRLPTEPEWEKAARGPQFRVYAWGDAWNPVACNSNEARLNDTSPVGKFSPAGDSPYGVADTGGNVQEWTSSLFGNYPYDPLDGREAHVYDLQNRDLLPKLIETGCTSMPESGEASLGKTVLRGGSFRESRSQARCAYRSWAAPMHRSDDTGFRCCYEP